MFILIVSVSLNYLFAVTHIEHNLTIVPFYQHYLYVIVCGLSNMFRLICGMSHFLFKMVSVSLLVFWFKML